MNEGELQVSNPKTAVRNEEEATHHRVTVNLARLEEPLFATSGTMESQIAWVRA